MQLDLKSDFEQARQRWDVFWKGQSTDRPPVIAIIPKPGVEPVARPHAYDMPRGNLDAFVDQVVGWAASHEFLGDAIPSYVVTFAADHFALLLGAQMKYSGKIGRSGAETGWIIPFLDDYETPIRFQPECHWWEKTALCVRALRKRADGRLLTCPTHLQGGLDALAAIRGNQRLLVDLIERPDDVKWALGEIDQALADARRALAEICGVAEFGCANRFYMYSRGSIDVPQCDFSCMISQEMFRKFGVPSLKSDCAPLDGAIYHLDGPGAIRHLEAVCAVDKIRLIQWVPGAGAPQQMDWSELYRRIDDLGTGQLRAGTKARIKEMWHQYKSRYLCFTANGIASRQEADDFLGELAAMGKEG